MSENIAKEKTKKLVPCRGIKFSPLLSLDQCRKCQFFLKTKVIKPAQNNIPPIEVVICGLPTSVRINYFIDEEVPNKGKQPAIAHPKDFPTVNEEDK